MAYHELIFNDKGTLTGTGDRSYVNTLTSKLTLFGFSISIHYTFGGYKGLSLYPLLSLLCFAFIGRFCMLNLPAAIRWRINIEFVAKWQCVPREHSISTST